MRTYFDPCDLLPDDTPNCRVTTAGIGSLWTALAQLLDGQHNVQILYFSAHGDEHGNFGFSPYSCQNPYPMLMQELAKHLTEDCVHLVLGTCHAMNCFEQWEASVPQEVFKVTGFWQTASPVNVSALMAGVIENDQRLLCCLGDYVNEHLQELDSNEIDELMRQHSQPTQNILGKGQIIVSYTRKPGCPGEWNRTFMSI